MQDTVSYKGHYILVTRRGEQEYKHKYVTKIEACAVTQSCMGILTVLWYSFLCDSLNPVRWLHWFDPNWVIP